MNSNVRIALNTSVLYTQLVITIAINLYATRLIIGAMGIEDFGIVNLVSGIVAMFSFIQSSMTVSSQRFLSVNMGHHDIKKQIRIFNSSFSLHVLLCLIIVILLEIAFPFVFNSDIKIPVERIESAKILYQLIILSTSIIIVGVPFDAALNAHENMLMVSVASILESVLRLIGAIWLMECHEDKLIFYGLLAIVIRLTSFLLKMLYCIYYYADSRISLNKSSWNDMNAMFSFASWNALGSFSMAIKSYGIAITLNMFLGVLINTAYGIANQVSAQLMNFSSTLTKAIAPQVMKSQGSGELDRMVSLSLKQSKYSFILLLMMTIPVFVDMPYILSLWLGEIPPYSVLFCRAILIVSLIQQITSGVMTAIQADGRIGKYIVVISIITCMAIPIAYFSLYLGLGEKLVLFSLVIIELLCMIVRFYFLHHLVRVEYTMILTSVLQPVSVLIVVSGVVVYIMLAFQRGMVFSNILLHACLSVIVVGICSFFILGKDEKDILRKVVHKICYRIKEF